MLLADPDKEAAEELVGAALPDGLPVGDADQEVDSVGDPDAGGVEELERLGRAERVAAAVAELVPEPVGDCTAEIVPSALPVLVDEPVDERENDGRALTEGDWVADSCAEAEGDTDAEGDTVEVTDAESVAEDVVVAVTVCEATPEPEAEADTVKEPSAVALADGDWDGDALSVLLTLEDMLEDCVKAAVPLSDSVAVVDGEAVAVLLEDGA